MKLVMLAFGALMAQSAFALDLFGIEFGKPPPLAECTTRASKGIFWSNSYERQQKQICWASDTPGVLASNGQAYIVLTDVEAPRFLFHQYDIPPHLNIRLIDGNVEEAFFDVHYRQFDDALAAFVAKFGKPNTRISGTVTTLAGAIVDNPEITWKLEDGEVFLIKRTTDIYIGLASLKSTKAANIDSEGQRTSRARQRPL